MLPKRKYPQLDNVVFLDRVGPTLRFATSEIVREELPEEIRILLRRLERFEARDRHKQAKGERK